MSFPSVEHRNMPQADAMVLVARNYERYKNDCREKEREEIARQAAKMANDAILQERDRGGPEEGGRGGHPPAIQSLINLLADNRYLTAEETDKIINYLRERKERLLRSSADSLPGELRGRAEVKFSLCISLIPCSVGRVACPGFSRVGKGRAVLWLSHNPCTLTMLATMILTHCQALLPGVELLGLNLVLLASWEGAVMDAPCLFI